MLLVQVMVGMIGFNPGANFQALSDFARYATGCMQPSPCLLPRGNGASWHIVLGELSIKAANSGQFTLYKAG